MSNQNQPPVDPKSLFASQQGKLPGQKPAENKPSNIGGETPGPELKQVPQQIPETPDWKMAEEKITQVYEHLKRFEGQPKHNPFAYYRKFVKPLADLLMSKDFETQEFDKRTPDLFVKIMKLKIEAPTVDKVPQGSPAIITALPPATNLWDGKVEGN